VPLNVVASGLSISRSKFCHFLALMQESNQRKSRQTRMAPPFCRLPTLSISIEPAVFLCRVL
jgi:hypothetical protein